MTTFLKLERTSKGEKATIGSLYWEDAFQCFTLEDKVREVPGEIVSQWKVPGQTAIPAGNYQVVIDFSTRFKRLMPHILEVPGFTGIRIHKGNTDADTEGCILLGQQVAGPDMITHSTEAFEAFFPRLQAALGLGDVFISIGDV